MKFESDMKNLFYFPEPISIGRASIAYSSPNDFNLSFKSRDKITVFSKPAAETSDDVWYVEINGKYGYAPKKFIQEEKVVVSSSKLILVQNVATVTPPLPTLTPKTEEKVQNINESSPDVQSAEITKNSSEVSDVNEVKNEERLKRSVDLPSSASKTVDISENAGATKVDEVKIEDLNKYDSKNFDENAESNDEDGDEDDDEEDDEYDDAENSLDSELSEEEEIRQPVVEEPFVKKTAYVTTHSKVDNSSDIGKDGVQPTLEIMAPTQSEIEQLKQQQQMKNSIPDSTLSTVDSSVDSENASVPTTSTLEPVASENQFTTTTVPIDEPQNPLHIAIETTTPLPDAAKNKQDVDASKFEQKKGEEEVHTNLVSGNDATTDNAIPKVDSATKETPKSEEPLKPTANDLLNDQIPPFKPLPPSPEPVDNIGSDLNESTTDIPNVNASVVDQAVGVDKPVDAVSSVTQEPEKPSNLVPSNDANAAANDESVTVLRGENQIAKEYETVATQPTEVVDNNLEVSNESLPMEVATTTESSAVPPIQDSKVVVESVDSVDINYDTNNATSTSSDDTVHAENEIVSPIEIISSEKTDDVIATVDYLTQNVNEGVGVIEPIIQLTNAEEQHQAGDDINLESEQPDNVESKEGIFGMVMNSLKNLFGGSSTVESLVEEQPSNENFDKALNDILFSQATSDESGNEGMCQPIFFFY